MYGSVREWVVSDLKGWRKFENFKLMRLLYTREPKHYVFVGDTGEARMRKGGGGDGDAASGSSVLWG